VIRHFLDLDGARTIPTEHLLLSGRAVADLVETHAMGAFHGDAGLGKTFAVERAVEGLGGDWEPVWLSFPARPTMRLIAIELLAAISGSHTQHDRFKITRLLKAELALAPRLIVVDEAQNLNRECIEFLRHLSEDPQRRGAILLVGGDGCWEVLSREPMLRSRVYRRVAFTPLTPREVLRVIRAFHALYEGASDELIRFIDNYCGHGNLRNWASFTLSALDLCAELKRDRLDEQLARNAFALLGGGVGAA